MVPGAGVRLAVRTSGNPGGEPVLLIHGFPDTSAVWDPLRALLDERFLVITYDVRGAGASGDPGRGGYGLDLLVADLEAVLDATVGSRPVHLVGHDWGSLQAWEAVLRPRVAARFASFTSCCGPPLDHVALRARVNLRRGPAGWGDLARQAVRSTYVQVFHLPGLPRLVAGAGPGAAARMRRAWAAYLGLVEGLTTNDRWPEPTFAGDAGRGMHLYRANVRSKLRRPHARTTEVPTQLVVAARDRYLLPATFDGLERWAQRSWRRDVPYGHWVVRSHPQVVAGAITELVDHLAGGPPAPALVAARRS
jgi:pimeloyl-ACP methyl ester carboxylesterase